MPIVSFIADSEESDSDANSGVQLPTRHIVRTELNPKAKSY